jgi:hypothetical protein
MLCTVTTFSTDFPGWRHRPTIAHTPVTPGQSLLPPEELGDRASGVWCRPVGAGRHSVFGYGETEGRDVVCRVVAAFSCIAYALELAFPTGVTGSGVELSQPNHGMSFMRQFVRTWTLLGPVGFRGASGSEASPRCSGARYTSISASKLPSSTPRLKMDCSSVGNRLSTS